MFLLSLAASAQAPRPEMPTLTLKLAPLAVLDPTTPCLLVGAEYRPTDRLGVEVQYGGQFMPLQLTGFGLTENRRDFRYHKIKVELRRYLEVDDAHPRRQTIFALQPFFIPQQYVRGKGYFHDGRQYIGYDEARVEKNIIGLAAKVGMVWNLGSHWQLEATTGLGGRYMNVKFWTVNRRIASEMGTFAGNMFNQIERPGEVINIHVEANVKVGYVLRLPGRRG
jgi:Protein of unknown function (DUF3575)